jgi:diguanylate cyclase (GGDEF)-like protein
MKRTRWLLYALLTSAAVVLGLLLLRVTSVSIPSAALEFLRYRLTYLYVFAATSVVFLIVGFVLGRQIDRFRRLSAVDSLTGLANRSVLDARLHEEWRRAERYHSPLSLLLIDVDGLKRVNDEAGHAAGDQILRKVATAIKVSLRTMDVGARWGGDEFAVLAPNTAPDAAERMAQRLLSEMDRQGGNGPGAPASIGVATFDSHHSSDTADALMRRADAALYRAKTSGRHQVRIA